jgi:hypothetical protein
MHLCSHHHGHRPARDQQQPAPADRLLLDLVYQHFKGRAYDFEQFAADLWRMSEPNVDKIDVTRPWRDDGRDAVGESTCSALIQTIPSSTATLQPAPLSNLVNDMSPPGRKMCR